MWTVRSINSFMELLMNRKLIFVEHFNNFHEFLIRVTKLNATRLLNMTRIIIYPNINHRMLENFVSVYLANSKIPFSHKVYQVRFRVNNMCPLLMVIWIKAISTNLNLNLLRMNLLLISL